MEPVNKMYQRRSTTPINAPLTRRGHQIRTLTSMPAGKVVPIVCSPVLREDALQRGQVRLSFEMHETAELLLNAVNVNVQAWLVPWLAFDRFASMDEFNKSYEGLPYRDGDAVIDFFETDVMPAIGVHEIYEYLGLHAKTGDDINTAYQEAYNLIQNHRRINRSPDITLRNLTDTDLARAFWAHDAMRHIVPDFDQAKMDGEVALNVVNAQLPVSGFAYDEASSVSAGPSANARESDGSQVNYTDYRGTQNSGLIAHVDDSGANPIPQIFAELASDGITVSLANIELAKKTQAFAKLREKFTGHSDDFLIDLLMDGISVPEQSWRQPMLLAEKNTIFGMNKRYATSSGALDESAVNGATFIDLSVRTPKVPTGGVMMITAEVTPEQLFERQKDVFFHLSSVDELPQYLRDELDPEKVEVVPNNYVDVDHTTPADTFGYAPLNFQWDMKAPKIGGRFYRPAVDEATDEDRQRIWAVETTDPVLSEDFYLCTTMHTKPFADTVLDPFEVVATGQLIYSGLTVFGPVLHEASNDYESVLAEADNTRIDKTA